jgi:hypothetical protein
VRLIAALAAFAACGAPTVAGVAPEPELYAAVDAAWWAVGVPAPDYAIVLVDDPQGPCTVERPVDGCTNHGDPDVLIVQAGMSPERTLTITMHELGHAIRVAGGHLPCDGPTDVMCAAGGLDGEPPTERDAEFVWGVRAGMSARR